MSLYTPLSVQTRSRSTIAVPPDAWDSHMHVTDPKRFPLSRHAKYQPHMATLQQARQNADRLHIPNLVFVQPSTYGNDNTCLLDALKQVGPAHGRGVVAFNPEATDPETLAAWHKLGVRGVRINVKSVGETISPEELERQVVGYDRVLKDLPWAIQLYIDLAMIPELGRVAKQLPHRKIVVDHFGSPPKIGPDMAGLAGWTELVDLVREQRNFYVKISAPYRFVKEAEYDMFEPVVRELLQAALQERGGDGVVFASDWPHTRFEDANVQPFLQKCLDWCDEDEALALALFRRNAELLWDVER